MLIVFTALLAGFLHVLAGPDHLAAVSPIAIETKKSGWLIGLKWGLGHTAGVFLVGFLILLFRELIPIDLVSSFSERIVGVVLIGIGLYGFRAAFKNKLHVHEHKHDDTTHYHFHLHNKEIPHENKKAHFHTHAALAVGVIHGLAGSSHLLGVLPALALPTQTQAAIYLLSFGIGTIAAMIIFSHALGLIAYKFENLGAIFYRRLSYIFNFAAIAIGIYWLG